MYSSNSSGRSLRMPKAYFLTSSSFPHIQSWNRPNSCCFTSCNLFEDDLTSDNWIVTRFGFFLKLGFQVPSVKNIRFSLSRLSFNCGSVLENHVAHRCKISFVFLPKPWSSLFVSIRAGHWVFHFLSAEHCKAYQSITAFLTSFCVWFVLFVGFVHICPDSCAFFATFICSWCSQELWTKNETAELGLELNQSGGLWRLYHVPCRLWFYQLCHHSLPQSCNLLGMKIIKFVPCQHCQHCQANSNLKNLMFDVASEGVHCTLLQRPEVTSPSIGPRILKEGFKAGSGINGMSIESRKQKNTVNTS